LLALLIGRSALIESWSSPVLVFLQGIPAGIPCAFPAFA